MTSHCNLITRAAAFLLLMLALWSVPAGVYAQDAPCVCDHYTFRVGTNVSCDVEICWTFSEDGPVYCQKVRPGGTLRIPCPVWAAYITLCNGSYTIISNVPPISVCTGTLRVGPSCCVRACWTTDREGCELIDIQPVFDCNDIDC